MTLTMYQASVPAFQRTLRALDAVLDKAAAYAEERKIDPEVLTSARLSPECFPWCGRCNSPPIMPRVPRPARRLGGAEFRRHRDDIPRVQGPHRQDSGLRRHGAPPRSTDRRPAISLKAGPRELYFTGQEYLVFFAVPNFYFHVTTAYDILRQAASPSASWISGPMA